MSGYDQELKDFKKVLDGVSPSFCSAKWLQTTLHLQNGRTHSCHHPSPHAIPIQELENYGPTALHNTKYKKEQRRQMLAGERPKECQYCWNIEDLPGDHTSDRPRKSMEPWAKDKLDSIIASDSDANILPTYVEVSFSNACNFKCSYCSPVHSSQWVKEIRDHGPYNLGSRMHNGLEYFEETGQLPSPDADTYILHFRSWLLNTLGPSRSLQVLRITGGEPTQTKEFAKLWDILYQVPQPQMELCINTNLGMDKKGLEDFADKINLAYHLNLVKSVTIHTSCDAAGAQAEYTRHGLNYNQWLENCQVLLNTFPNLTINIMCTTNIFSLTSMDRFLADVLALKLCYHTTERTVPVTIDFSILRWPGHQSLSIMPYDFADMFNTSLAFMEKWRDDTELVGGSESIEAYGVHYNKTHSRQLNKGFYDFEISKFKRMMEFTRNPPDLNEGVVSIQGAWRDFYLFVDEHDKRRGTDFKKTFPELVEFYNLAKATHKNNVHVILTNHSTTYE